MNETLVKDPPQVKLPDPPETKKIVMKRLPLGKWEIKMNANIKIRDIVHLRRALVIEFKRNKRAVRMERQALDRNNKLKEQVNGKG